MSVCSTADSDRDGVADTIDNCLDLYNPNQTDVNNNHYGDECDCNHGKKCFNEGKCIQRGFFYDCVCMVGTSGTHCEINVQECLPYNHCSNNSKCVDAIGAYHCECNPGSWGMNCGLKSGYSYQLDENIKAGTVVDTITPSDDTMFDIRKFDYKLISGASNVNDPHFPFAVKPSTGVLYVKQSPDREFSHRYEFELRVSDHGILYPLKPRVTSTPITITLSDLNDNTPKFTRSVFFFDVSNKTPRGQLLGRVTATDKDEGKNGTVRYRLLSASRVHANNKLVNVSTDMFKVDEKNGDVYSQAMLVWTGDSRQFKLNVEAHDLGTPSMSNSAGDVRVRLWARNDHSPKFVQPRYTGSVREDALSNVTIVAVAASDFDAGLSGKIHFSIVERNFSDWFSINKESGVISPAKGIDREIADRVTLVVNASDRSHLPSMRQWSTAEVVIDILDANDNAPQFSAPELTTFVADPLRGQIVARLSATDADIGANAAITYESVVNKEDLVTVSKDGIVRLAKRMPELPHSTYILVKATDGGSPPMSSTQRVIVTGVVAGMNLTEPIAAHFTVHVRENTPPGTLFASPDLLSAIAVNETMRKNIFRVPDGQTDLVRLDRNNGSLYTTDVNIDREAIDTIPLLVKTTVGGLKSSIRILVKVLDENDNSPRFTKPFFTGMAIAGPPDREYTIANLAATDADTGANAALGYMINDPEDLIETSRGSSRVVAYKPLTRGLHKLTVTVFDDGTPQLRESTQLYVMVYNKSEVSTMYVRNMGTNHKDPLMVRGQHALVKALNITHGKAMVSSIVQNGSW